MPLTPPPFPEKNSGSVHGHHYELHVHGEEIVHCTCTSIYADKIHCIHYTHTDLNRHVTSCYSCAYEFLMLISEHRNYIVNFLQILTK